ncbi:drug/metabolite transporter superfamily protein YnfA [Alkalibacillus flavidus]|uniref:Drug/metabolite transporter superfamily protein YnfA n=1 Tax=Alkalibacillus flavidus TaxID=546021 RepID=A0ABV2KT81_9BACI
MAIMLTLVSIIIAVLVVVYSVDRLRGVSRRYFSVFNTLFTLAVIAYFLTESMQRDGWAFNGHIIVLFGIAIVMLVIDYKMHHQEA